MGIGFRVFFSDHFPHSTTSHEEALQHKNPGHFIQAPGQSKDPRNVKGF